MAFMGKAIGKMLTILSFLGLFGSKKEIKMPERPPYIRHVDALTNTFVKKMEALGFHCRGDGGSMPYDVRTLYLSFFITKGLTIEESREKIVFLTEQFREEINQYEPIRPYLREYPFPAGNVHISLLLKTKKPIIYGEHDLSQILSANNQVFYFGDSCKSQDSNILKEPYDEALAIVNKSPVKKAPPPEPSKSLASLDPNRIEKKESKQRMGTFVGDLAGFTAERALEALGIKQVDGYEEMADDLGELIGGVCDLYFNEDFLARLDEAAQANSDGEYVEYWDNGQIKVRIPYKNRFAEGHIHGWYPNGTDAFKGYYQNGKRVGNFMAFFPEEEGKGRDPFARCFTYDEKGMLTWEQITHSRQGRLLAYVHYTNGIPNGETSFWAGFYGKGCFGKWNYKEGVLVPDEPSKKKK